MNEELEKQIQLQKQIEQLEKFVKQYLSKEAISRYGNIKTANPDKAIQILLILNQLIQSGQLQEKLTDDQFKQLLLHLNQGKKDFKLRF